MSKLNVLITGAGGRIGRRVWPALQKHYDLHLLDHAPIPDAPDTILADLQDKAALEAAMQGMDVVLHLAATSDEAPFLEELVPNNVVGLYNTYQAAVDAGVRRVIFASTVQTVGAYPGEHDILITDPPRPNSMYGATKVFGETLGRWFHDRHGLEVVVIRIGWFLAYDDPILRDPRWRGDIWLSPNDAVGLFRRAIEVENPGGDGYALVFGTSRTTRERLSRAPARELLGFEPQDDATNPPPPGTPIA